MQPHPTLHAVLSPGMPFYPLPPGELIPTYLSRPCSNVSSLKSSQISSALHSPMNDGHQLSPSLDDWIFRASLQSSSQPDFLAQCLAQNRVLELTEHEMVLKNKLWLKDKQGRGGVTGLPALLPLPRCRHTGLTPLGGPAPPSGPLH